MSQFAIMLPTQGGGAGHKAAGTTSLETASNEALAGNSFSEALAGLSQENPNNAALLLVLQQMGMLADELPVNLTGSGSLLPQIGVSGGNLLPLGQNTPHSNLQSLTLLNAEMAASQKPAALLDERLAVLASQSLPRIGTVAGESFQALESRGLVDFGQQTFGLGLTAQNPLSSTGARPLISLPLQLPVGQPGWDGALAERIQWMMGKQVQAAEIRLNPPELGPLEIRLSVKSDNTSVNFIAAHAATRDALEAAIPRLREMFGEIHLNLANVDVSQRGAGESHQREDGSSAADTGYDEGLGDGGESIRAGSPVTTAWSNGILDTYA